MESESLSSTENGNWERSNPHKVLSESLDIRNLKLPREKASPTRRVWIPKPGSTEEKRPLNIPTIFDRAKQTLFKMALEPQWEAKFEANSFGFRPGRSCHDAIVAIFQNICHKPKWILETDISKCFDKIAHQPLLKKLKTSPFIARQIRDERECVLVVVRRRSARMRCVKSWRDGWVKLSQNSFWRTTRR